MKFPSGTTGYVLDSVARRPLWADGLDYRHGTGHGVGHFLNVHEGPQGIGPRPAYNEVGLVEGMVLSNEPGYYEDGKFGIRIESVVGVRNAQTANNFGGKGYLEFEAFTMVRLVADNADSSALSRHRLSSSTCSLQRRGIGSMRTTLMWCPRSSRSSRRMATAGPCSGSRGNVGRCSRLAMKNIASSCDVATHQVLLIDY